MKVYFVGSHSTGKTTLARYVTETYNLPMITEVARSVLSEKELHLDTLRTNLKVVDDYQRDIIFRQLHEEFQHESFVSDRSFDCLAYAAQHSRILSSLLPGAELPASYYDINQYISKLKQDDTIIFFVRPSKATMKADGVRESLTWDGIIAIDAMVKFMLEMWDIRHFQISVDNMQERVKLIDSVLSLVKAVKKP